MSRLESRWEAIDRRVTKLQASKAAYRRCSSNYDSDPYQQHHYVDFDCRQPRRRPTCWDPPSRTSARCVGEIRAPPLPEPPPQSAPDLLYGPPPCGTSNTYVSEHTTRSSFWSGGFPPADSATPHHPLTTISNHSHTLSQPQLVLDQNPPLQHLLDQQPQPSHRRAVAPLAPAAAPPPPLYVDQHRSPSCCHPTTHLRQAEACLELPTTVQQPLLQRPPSCLHQPSLHSLTKLVSCEEQNSGIEGDSKVLNQVDLQLNEKKLVDEEVRAIEVNKIDEDDGLHDSSKVAAFDFDGCLAKTSVKGVNADTWSLVSPSIPEKLHNRYKDELHDAREDMVNGLKATSIYSSMGVKRMGELDNKPFHDRIMRKFVEDVYIEYAIVGYWRLKQRSCPFDPGGDTSPKLLRSTLRCFVVSTLRTMWILTVGELLRVFF